jgi:hypothetical protein
LHALVKLSVTGAFERKFFTAIRHDDAGVEI